MKINSLGIQSTPYTAQPALDSLSPGAEHPAATSSAGQGSYSPSPQLLQLIDLLRRQPEVRADRVQVALERLQQGFYDTPAAIEQVATAMTTHVPA